MRRRIESQDRQVGCEHMLNIRAKEQSSCCCRCCAASKRTGDAKQSDDGYIRDSMASSKYVMRKGTEAGLAGNQLCYCIIDTNKSVYRQMKKYWTRATNFNNNAWLASCPCEGNFCSVLRSFTGVTVFVFVIVLIPLSLRRDAMPMPHRCDSSFPHLSTCII